MNLLHLISASALLTLSPLLQSAEIPFIDLADDHYRQIVVDHEAGQYLGHPTTCLSLSTPARPMSTPALANSHLNI